MAETGDPVRQFMIDHLAERLGTILTTNGYHSNIGQNVVSENPQNVHQVDPIPAVILEQGVELPRDGEDEEGIAVGSYDRPLTVTFHAIGDYRGNKPMTEAGRMLADLQDLMGKDENLYFSAPTGSGTQNLKLRVKEGANLLDGDGPTDGRRIFAQVTYQITYITSRKDPHIGKPT